MEMKRKHAWFLRILALVMALGLLFGAIPVSALDDDTVPAEDESIVSDEGGDAGDQDVQETNEEPSEATDSDVFVEEETVAEEPTDSLELGKKDDSDLADTAANPDNVTVSVNNKGYSSSGMYYNGIYVINVTVPSSEEFDKSKVKGVFAQGLDETADFENVPWWNNSPDYTEFIKVYTKESTYIIRFEIAAYVEKVYKSNFFDGLADGTYHLMFTYGYDGTDYSIFSRKFVIDNKAPKVVTDCGSNPSAWRTDKLPVNYSVSDDGIGMYKVQLFSSDSEEPYKTSTDDPTGTMYIRDSGTYYIRTTDKLGNVSDLQYVAEVNIDNEEITFNEDEVRYSKAAPGSSTWTNEEVQIVFTLNETPSGVGSIAVKDDDREVVKKGAGKYAVKTSEREDLEIIATTGAGKESSFTLKAPQIDTDKPTMENIRNIGIKSKIGSKYLHLLTFGLFTNKEMILTVYATADSGSPIAKIDADNDKLVKKGKLTETDGVYAQSFSITPQDEAEASEFINVCFTLTDKAGNVSEEAIPLKEIGKITIDSETTVDMAGEDLQKLIDTSIAPDIAPYTVTADQSSENGCYRDNIKITTSVSEPLTGVKDVKAYFGKESDFEKDEAGNYKPASAKNVSSSCVTMDEDGFGAQVSYAPSEKLASGNYVLYVIAENNAGNKMSSAKMITIDKDCPAIEEVTLPDDWTNSSKARITFKVKDYPEENNAGVKQVTVNGKTVTADKNGVYKITPEAGQNYIIDAYDTFENGTPDAHKTCEIKAEDVFFDDQPPTIGAFKYSNNDNNDWSKDVTVSFTLDDKYNGRTLSGVNAGTLTVVSESKKKIAEDNLKVVYDDVNEVYNCSFTVEENDTKYTVNVKDNLGNPAEAKTTDTIKRDQEEPVIEKIVFTNINKAKKYGVYSQDDILATVYVSSGCVAPVKDIVLYNGKTPMSPVSDEIGEEDVEIGNVKKHCFTKSFTIPASENGSTYSELGVYAVSAAGVHTAKDTTDGIIGIADINVYVDGDELKDKFKDFFEAVAKTAGPAIVPSYEFPMNFGDVQGYKHDEKGKINEFATFSYTVDDTIAGVDSSTIRVYYDLVDNFGVNEKGEYVPTGDTRQIKASVNPAVADDEAEKNTNTTGSYAEKSASKTGKYLLYVAANNYGGKDNSNYVEIDVDNSAPVIDNDTYVVIDGKNPSEEWVDKPVTVEFTVTDMPEGYCGGVDKVTVTGKLDGKTEEYEVKNLDGNKYSFTTDNAQEYEINAYDKFGIKAATFTTKKVLTDVEAPTHFKIEKIETYQSEWTADTKKIEFTVDDLSDKDFYPGKDDDLSGVYEITVTAKDMQGEVVKDDSGNVLTYPIQETIVNQCTPKTYSFIANGYYNYTISVKDAAGNEGVNTDLENICVDTETPVIDNVSFYYNELSPIETVLHFLTFGIYGHDDVTMVVKGTDPEASSSIKNVEVSFTDTSTGKTTKKTATDTVTGGKPGEAKIEAMIPVNSGLISNSKNISVTITDMVDHTSDSVSLYELYDTDPAKSKLTVPEGFKIDDKDFEFIINANKPTVGDFRPYTNDKNANPEFVTGNTYYYQNSNFSVDFTAKDSNSKLHGVTVTLNNSENDITEECYETGTSTKLTKTYTDFVPADPRKDQKIEQKDITANIYDLSESKSSALRRIRDVSEANVLTVTAQGNNGISTTVNSPDIFIDNIAPEITKFEFTGNGVSELTGDPNNTTETKEIDDAVENLGGITSDNYVYFFKDKTVVKVTATDTHNGIKGSGVRQITLITVGMKNVGGEVETLTYQSDAAEGNNGDLVAEFTVSAGFRGSLYAYATDQVLNDVNNKETSGGKYYNPHNLIVENSDLHNGSSSARITIDNTNYVTTDNNNHALYNGDVAVTFTIEDRYSGLKSFSYSCDGIKESAYLSGKVSIDINGKITDSNGGTWTVEEQDKNLIQKVSRTITLDGSSAFNSNDIQIELSGYDRSGYDIQKAENTISIDTTRPVIEITEYNPATGNTYGSDEYTYFKESRKVTVKVTERNFDPSLFDTSGIVNNYKSGDVPSLEASTDWSTSYSDYTDASTHYCTFTFANDGDYEIRLNCTDEAKNKADECTGEKFTIDTIDPTVEVSLDGTASNGKYYNKTVTATITVHEHNFAEGDTYVTFTPTTKFDTSYEASSSTPSISGWSGSGDTHTTTVAFSSDGTYSFTFDYKDKALRTAQQATQSEFVVDKNADKMITFVDVENNTAYGDTIEPKVKFDDTNLDSVTTSLTRVSLDTTDMTQKTEAASNLVHGISPASGSTRTDAYSNFPVEVENDGIYLFKASGTDLAGNSKEDSILFSVNRFGSTFMLASSSREWVDNGYTNAEKDLQVIEINVNPVTNPSVSITHNSQNRKLTKNSDFENTETGGNEDWCKYTYNIFKTNFEQEGSYTVTVSSTDEFKKSISNRTAYSDEAKGIIRNCPIAFVVDKTNPTILIEGVENNTPYGDPEKAVQIICTDTNIDPETLVIKDEKDNVLAEGTDYTLESLAGELDVELVVDTPGKHSLSVAVEDYATNTSTESVVDFELNASVFTLFFHNTVAVVCTAVGLAALVGLAIFLILRKRKKDGAAQ